MAPAELSEQISILKRLGLNTSRHRFALGLTYALALTPLFIVIIGLVIILSTTLSGKPGSLLSAGFVVAASFWLFLALGRTLSLLETIPPEAAAWIPNAFTLIAASIIIVRKRYA
jgi:lipopolysaccharide export LptBFGC system permease protein LptF